MKFQRVSLFALSLLLLPAGVFAGDKGIKVENEEINNIVANVKASQEGEAFDCAKVEEGNFETLGMAVVKAIHSNEEERALMEQMMGGEGSNSLAAAHSVAGRQYLGCWTGGNAMGMMDKDGWHKNDYDRMYGDHKWGATGHFLVKSLIGVLALLGVVWLVQSAGTLRQEPKNKKKKKK